MVNKLIKKIIMGCGCKNKTNQQVQQAQQAQQAQTQSGGNATQVKTNVQENVKKIINKYYRR